MNNEPQVQLKVVEAIQDDVNRAVVRLDSSFMKSLGVNAGDFVQITGERTTVALVDRSLPGDIGLSIIRMDGVIRRNAKTSIGDYVSVTRAEVVEATKVVIAPAREGIKIKVDNPLFFNRALHRRALVKGDLLSLGGTFSRFGLGDLKFLAVDVAPKKQAVVVSDRTEIVIGESTEVKDEEAVPEVSYEDIGGLNEELRKVREMIELPLRYPELFETLGIEPPKGVLLHGPPGTGKTLLAKAVAHETNSNFFVINGPEIMSKFYGQSEENLRKIFEEAEKNAPSIIFIDEIDAIAPKREESKGEVERRVVAQLLTIMDGLNTRGKVVVMAATNIPNSIDPALRRPGRFDREIEINPPSADGRLNILKIHTRNMPLQGEFYEDIAAETLLSALDKKLTDKQRFDHHSANKLDKLESLASLKQNKELVTNLIKQIVLLESSQEIWSAQHPAEEYTKLISKNVPAQINTVLTDLIELEIIDKSFYNQVRRSGAIDRELQSLADITHGFVGADLASLAKEAAMIVLRKLLPELKLGDEEELPREVLDSIKITKSDLLEALKVVRPSAMREVLIQVPNVSWNDVGGLSDVKQQLKEAVEWPLQNKEAFHRMGVRPPRGVLLYGPPGTGKTLLAKAVAKESEANFIAIKGPELLSKWVGESERAVREVFNKARQVSPSIIFIDEIDAMAANRSGDSDNKVNEKIVNQLLTEMDGLQELNDVVVIAATNRPDVMDTALLRPGRFDRIIMVGVPDAESRKRIFSVHFKGMPLAKNVDIERLVQETDGYVGADIEAVCREAAIHALRENMEAQEVTWKSFDHALKKVRPSASKDIQEAYAQLQDKFSSARGKQMQAERPNYYG